MIAFCSKDGGGLSVVPSGFCLNFLSLFLPSELNSAVVGSEAAPFKRTGCSAANGQDHLAPNAIRTT